MEAIVRIIKDTAYATVKEKVNPGDFVINNGELLQVNQSTCIFYDYKVEGPINPAVSVSEGEKIEILYKCALEDKCNYPFCAGICKGNKGFWVMGKENRGY